MAYFNEKLASRLGTAARRVRAKLTGSEAGTYVPAAMAAGAGLLLGAGVAGEDNRLLGGTLGALAGAGAGFGVRGRAVRKRIHSEAPFVGRTVERINRGKVVSRVPGTGKPLSRKAYSAEQRDAIMDRMRRFEMRQISNSMMQPSLAYGAVGGLGAGGVVRLATRKRNKEK